MNYHNPAISGLITGVPLTALLDSDRLERDIHYMKQYYPKQVLRLAEITELVADHYDTPRSFFYDEFPDRISTLHILKEIMDAYHTEQALDTAKRETSTDSYEGSVSDAVKPALFLPNEETASAIAELLLLQEILIRRVKRRNSPKKTFPMP